MTRELDRIFNPSAVAILGASSNPDKLGNVLVKGFLDMGFEGNLYPINPDTRRRVYDLNVYASVTDVPGEIDLAVITLSPEVVVETATECINKGVKGIILFTAFPHGVGPQSPGIKEMMKLARDKGVRIIGPNSMGLYCPSSGLAIFANMPRKTGPVGFMSHSGAISFAFSLYLGNRGVGLSKVIAVGNDWDLTWTDFLEYLGQDAETEIIGGYLEGVTDGERFLRVATDVARRKPVILIKAGMSPTGSKFVNSHTGSIAGDQKVWDAVLRQTGVICVDSFDDLVAHAIIFNYFRHHQVGDRIAIISGTGGPITISADLCDKIGLKIPLLSASVKAELRKILPAYGTSEKNPVDVSIAAATNVGLYTHSVELLDKTHEVDAMICLHTGDWRGEGVAKALAGIASHVHKPLMVALPGTPEKISDALAMLFQAGIPGFSSLESPLKAYASLVKWRRWKVG